MSNASRMSAPSSPSAEPPATCVDAEAADGNAVHREVRGAEYDAVRQPGVPGRGRAADAEGTRRVLKVARKVQPIHRGLGQQCAFGAGIDQQGHRFLVDLRLARTACCRAHPAAFRRARMSGQVPSARRAPGSPAQAAMPSSASRTSIARVMAWRRPAPRRGQRCRRRPARSADRSRDPRAARPPRAGCGPRAAVRHRPER